MFYKLIMPAALPADEAASFIGVPRASFDRLAKADPAIRGIRIGGRLVYRVRSLEAYLQRRELQEGVSDA